MSAPVKNIKDGWFSTGVFEAEKDGRKYYQISLQKGFKRNGSDEVEYQTISLFDNDLLKVASILEKTYWAILDLKETGKTTVASKPAQTQIVKPVNTPVSDDEIPF